MLSARGRHLLFADADGASQFKDLEKLETELKNLKTEVSLISQKNPIDLKQLCYSLSLISRCISFFCFVLF